MPYYEYKCDRCGAVVVLPLRPDPDWPHEGCSGTLRRIFSTFSFRIK